MKIMMSTFMIVGLLFGSRATVAAAQDDLPYEPLYPIKLVSEDLTLWWVSDPAAQIELLMQQAQTRTAEMAALVEDGITPPSELSVRAQERIRRALQLAADLDEPALTTTLQQIHTQLQTQEQLMSRLQDGTCVECEPILQQTRDMLRIQLRQIEGGIDHPQTSPNQSQNQHQIRITQTPVAIGETAVPQVSCTPVLDGTGQQNGGGNPSAGTPMPQDNSTNQGGGGLQNGSDNGGSNQTGNDNGNGNRSGDESGNGNGSGNDTGQGSGGHGGKP